MSPIRPAITLTLLLVSMCCINSVVSYVKNACYCNFDDNLRSIHSKIMQGKPYTYVPTVPTTANPNEGGQSRKKREVVSPRTYDLGVVPTPNGLVSYGNKLEFSDTTGVFFDDDYRAGNCTCAKGSPTLVSLCLLELPFKSHMRDPLHADTRAFINAILPMLNNILVRSLKTLYVRTMFVGMEPKGAYVLFKARVRLSEIKYRADYYVRSALEPALSEGTLGKFESIPDCMVVDDETPPNDMTVDALGPAKYLLIPVALGVFILMLFCTCIGKADRFYVRFW